MTWYNVIGLLGVVLTILAYFLLQFRKVSTDQLIYPLMNIAAGAFILLTTHWEWSLTTFTLQVGWILVGLYGLIKIIRKKSA